MRQQSGRSHDEGGFTLIELLAVISILGVISFTLTEAVILGFKTTDAVTTDVTRVVGVQTLRSYFVDDVRRAEKVSDPVPQSLDPCSASPEAILYLTRTDDDGTGREVAYVLEANTPVAGERQLVRWECTVTGPSNNPSRSAAERELGLLEFDPAGALPVQALCDGATCPPGPAVVPPDPAKFEPATVTLRLLTNRPKDLPTSIDFTVRRRTT